MDIFVILYQWKIVILNLSEVKMLYIIRGTSCSGKDTFINKNFDEHCVLSSDKIRLLLTNDMKDQSKNKMVFEYLKHTLELRLTNGCFYTVINATNLKYRDVDDYVQMAKKLGFPVTVISIDPPSLEELYRRSKERGENGGLFVPDEVIFRHYNTYYEAIPRFMELANDGEFKFVRVNQKGELV